jgi:hypothetical protein
VVITGGTDDFAVWSISSGTRNARLQDAGLVTKVGKLIDDISADGKVIIGQYFDRKSVERPLRWTSSGAQVIHKA